MKTIRPYLLLGMLALVALAITGCFGDTHSTPKAIFSASQVEEVIPFTANFDATLSYNPDGEIKSYLWNFGDGGSGSGPQVAHDYTDNGTYKVSLTVVASDGSSNSSSITIQALNIPPVASFSYSPKSELDDEYVVGASEWVIFDATESTDDEEIVAYSWNFGDGWKDDGEVVEHRYLWAGTYNVALTVTDNDGGKTTFVNAIKVMGGPPCNANLENDEEVVRLFSDRNTGEFLLCIPTNRDYALNVSGEGYMFYSENFSLSGFTTETEPFIKNISLSPIDVGETIILRNIFFDTGKYNLKPESVSELKKILEFMENNPTLKIEIGGHTDNVGGETYNLALSENRAKSVFDFLTQRGIEPSRLTYRGFGYSKPIATNDTQDGRAKNRRTEISITGISE